MNIMGKAELTKAQMLEYINKVNPNPRINTTISNLIDLFLDEGEIEGVRGDIAFVQSTWETNNFKFTGDVVPAQNNYAGIGTIGGGVKGHYFKTPQLGVRAQIQHLKAYASKEPLKQTCVDPRFNLVTRGKSTTVQGLSGSWAADKNYGNSLINRYNEMAQTKGGNALNYTLSQIRDMIKKGLLKAKDIIICLDYGHGKGSDHNRGYKGPRWKNEGDGNYFFGKMLKKELETLGFTVVETRPNQANDPTWKSRGNKAKGCYIFISLHTNAGGGTGVEIFGDINAYDISLMQALCSTISKTLNIANRKVKYRYLDGTAEGKTVTTPPKGKSNYYAVLRYNLVKYGMLIEHCFHDNLNDVTKYEKNAETLARNMAKTIAEHYGVSGETTPPPKPVAPEKTNDFGGDIDVKAKETFVIACNKEYLNDIDDLITAGQNINKGQYDNVVVLQNRKSSVAPYAKVPYRIAVVAEAKEISSYCNYAIVAKDSTEVKKLCKEFLDGARRKFEASKYR